MSSARPPPETATDGVPPAAGRWWRRLGFGLGARSATFKCTLAALAAWTTTVAPLTLSVHATVATRGAALSALLAGTLGPQLLERHHARARHVGISLFVTAVAVTWAAAARDGSWGSVDAFRAVLGGLAWAVFALAWSHPWSVPVAALRQAPRGESGGLTARRKSPRSALLVAGVGAAVAAGLWLMAWRVREPTRSVLAHTGAAGSALAIIMASAVVALRLGAVDRRGPRGRQLLSDRPLLHSWLLMLAVAAALLVTVITGR